MQEIQLQHHPAVLGTHIEHAERLSRELAGRAPVPTQVLLDAMQNVGVKLQGDINGASVWANALYPVCRTPWDRTGNASDIQMWSLLLEDDDEDI